LFQAVLKSKSYDSADASQKTVLLHKDFHSTPMLSSETNMPFVGSSKDTSAKTSSSVDARNAKNARSFAADFELSLGIDSTQHLPSNHEDKVGDMRGYFTLPGCHKKMIDKNGSYRAVSNIGPVNISMHRPDPPDHPPPPPPQACQVVLVDTKSGDYARAVVKSPDKEPETSPGKICWNNMISWPNVTF